MKQVKYLREGKTYLIYNKGHISAISEPFHGIMILTYKDMVQEANHMYYTGDCHWLAMFGHTSHSDTGTVFTVEDHYQKGVKLEIDLYDYEFFELTPEEYEKHVLIYGI